MCGRYSIILTAAEIAEIFGLARPDFVSRPRYNLAPTDSTPIIVAEEEVPKLVESRFGLIPFWSRETPSSGSGLINARAETVAEKPAFRRAFARSRCLIPADGFYEWHGEKKGSKTPYRIVMPDQRLFTFAGIYEAWPGPDGQVSHSFAIITTSANDTIMRLHHRMPVILDNPEERLLWLTSADPAAVSRLLRPYEGDLKTFAVSKLVNSVQNDGPECIIPVDQAAQPEGQRIF
ncbi:MAG TPA: SOS response-associated peptidase [Bacillota bacterium]|nr:SOS response-associated peptidase [Bacillota bacterium]